MYRRCDSERTQVFAEACEDLWTECFEYSFRCNIAARLVFKMWPSTLKPGFHMVVKIDSRSFSTASLL